MLKAEHGAAATRAALTLEHRSLCAREKGARAELLGLTAQWTGTIQTAGCRNLSTQSQVNPVHPSSVLLHPVQEAAVGCRAAGCGCCHAELQHQRCCMHVFNSQMKGKRAGM